MKEYKKLNIEPKYIHNRTQFGFQQYIKIVPVSVLVQDFEKAFVGQIQKKILEVENMSVENPIEANNGNNTNADRIDEFPFSNWKMSSVFDERVLGEDYWSAIFDRRTGKTGQIESEINQKQNKKIEERKIDRGFDILNTWKIKSNYLGPDWLLDIYIYSTRKFTKKYNY